MNRVKKCLETLLSLTKIPSRTSGLSFRIPSLLSEEKVSKQRSSFGTPGAVSSSSSSFGFPGGINTYPTMSLMVARIFDVNDVRIIVLGLIILYFLNDLLIWFVVHVCLDISQTFFRYFENT